MKRGDDKYYFDNHAADSAVKFIESYIRHVKGDKAGQLIVLEDWQKNIIKQIFGWKNKETGLRRYRKAYIEIPRKNGKSFLAACIILVMLFLDKEMGSEIYGAAGSRSQARIIFEVVRQIIEKEPRLDKRCDIFKNSIIVKTKNTESFYQTVSSESGPQHGFNAQCIVVDELHVHKNGKLLETLKTSMGSRSQPLLFMITTAGTDINSICKEWHDYAQKIIKDPSKDERLLALIYGADSKDDPFDEATWAKANPNYLISVKKEYLEEQATEAKHSAAFLNTFKTLHLGIWTNVRNAWIHDLVYDDAGTKFPDRENGIPSKKEAEFIENLKGMKCYGGLDLALTSDISAFSLIFYVDDKFISLNWFWLPEEQGAYSANTNNREYDSWVKDDYLVETHGATTDYGFIINKILEISEQYDLMGVGYDPAHASAMAVELDDKGIILYKHRSGFVSVNEPFSTLTKLIIADEFDHLSNPVLAWMASNVRVVQDSNDNIKPDRSKRNEKIDGILSNIYALMTYQFIKSQGPVKSYLEEGPLFTV